MKKKLLLGIVGLFMLYSGVAYAMPAKQMILVLAPNVAEFSAGVFASMPYSAKVAVWDVGVYEHYSHGNAFDPKGFWPENGYRRSMDFYEVAPAPLTSLAALLTGMKWKQGKPITDRLIQDELADKGWECPVAYDFESALSIISDFAGRDNGNPFGPGLFVVVLYRGTDAAVFAAGVESLITLVDEGGDAVNWWNTFVVVTRGWGDGNRPVPLFAEGAAVSKFLKFDRAWYREGGIIDNTQIYLAFAGAAWLPTPVPPKVVPLRTELTPGIWGR